MTTTAFMHRLARPADISALKPLMADSIRALLKDFLPPQAVEASFEVMGLDTRLIDDGTYFVIECDDAIAGCGGWSRRNTLFGGDHAAARNDALLDPRNDPARVRAMYTSPHFVRRGVGRLVLSLCESAAASEGFTRAELAATLAGEPLYRACGYQEIERFEAPTSKGIRVPLIRMGKPISERIVP
jgi:GNAT superfamily N-acetyltransferase